MVECATELRERIRIVAIERIGVELAQLLDLDDPNSGVRFLVATGLLAELLCFGEPERLPHVLGRQDRAAAVVGRVAGGWQTRLAALGAAVFDDEVAPLCRRLRLSRDDERTVVQVAQSALAVLRFGPIDPPSLRRWCAATEPVRRSAALEVASALEPESGSVRAFADGLAQLADREDIDTTTLLDGQQIMAALAIGAGPTVGEAARFLRESSFDRGPLSPETQVALLKVWWTDRVTNA